MKIPSLAKILEQSSPIPKGPPRRRGIYVLFKDQKAAYVGRSTNMDFRALESFMVQSRRGRVADRLAVVEYNEENLEELERAYITALKPSWNDDPTTRKNLGLGCKATPTKARRGTNFRPVITPEGEFCSAQNAADHFGTSRQAVWDKANRQAPGWRFKDIPERPPNKRGRPKKPIDT